MWNPKKIEICNLFSHKESEYEFKNNACTVIWGKNDTDKLLENNGAGKTTLFEAISISLTGESLRSIKKDAFINRDEDYCKITFHLENEVLNSKLTIVREFFRGGKSSKIELWENGELNTQLTSVNEANKRIIELIGISREDLLRYFIISQDNKYTFFTASDSEKKEIMNRITSADMINPIFEELSARYSTKNDEYKDLNLEVGRLAERVSLAEEQREELLLESESNKDVIEGIEKDIEGCKKEEKQLEKDMSKLINDKKNLQEKISSIVVPDISNLKNKLRTLRKKIDELEDELSEVKKIRGRVKRKLEGAITCPNCKEDFIPQTDDKWKLTIPEAKSLIEETETSEKHYDDIIANEKKNISKLKSKIDAAEEKQEELDYQKHKLRGNESDINILQRKKGSLTKEIQRLETSLESLKGKTRDNKALNKLKDIIEKAENEIKQKTSLMNDITDDINMIKFWQFNMGKSGFQTYLANKSVKIIEGITNSFLKKFGVDISVLINGYKVLKDGTIREKIDIFVVNDGINTEQFLAKSGGERGRVMMAGLLGIQHLINLSSDGKGLNLLLLDEVFSGVDSLGQEKIIKILNNLGITIMMITQNVSESFNNDNTLYVVKEDGVSKYINPQSL